jgi:hypothetical protein
MMQLAQRLAHAPSNEARMCEVTGMIPDATLARYGLAHKTSALTTALTMGGMVLVGAAIGAGVALLFAPTSGRELQQKMRRSAKRMSREMRKATTEVEAKVESVRDTASSAFGGETGARRQGPRA